MTKRVRAHEIQLIAFSNVNLQKRGAMSLRMASGKADCCAQMQSHKYEIYGPHEARFAIGFVDAPHVGVWGSRNAKARIKLSKAVGRVHVLSSVHDETTDCFIYIFKFCFSLYLRSRDKNTTWFDRWIFFWYTWHHESSRLMPMHVTNLLPLIEWMPAETVRHTQMRRWHDKLSTYTAQWRLSDSLHAPLGAFVDQWMLRISKQIISTRRSMTSDSWTVVLGGNAIVNWQQVCRNKTFNWIQICWVVRARPLQRKYTYTLMQAKTLIKIACEFGDYTHARTSHTVQYVQENCGRWLICLHLLELKIQQHFVCS